MCSSWHLFVVTLVVLLVTVLAEHIEDISRPGRLTGVAAGVCKSEQNDQKLQLVRAAKQAREARPEDLASLRLQCELLLLVGESLSRHRGAAHVALRGAKLVPDSKASTTAATWSLDSGHMRCCLSFRPLTSPSAPGNSPAL